MLSTAYSKNKQGQLTFISAMEEESTKKNIYVMHLQSVMLVLPKR